MSIAKEILFEQMEKADKDYPDSASKPVTLRETIMSAYTARMQRDRCMQYARRFKDDGVECFYIKECVRAARSLNHSAIAFTLMQERNRRAPV